MHPSLYEEALYLLYLASCGYGDEGYEGMGLRTSNEKNIDRADLIPGHAGPSACSRLF